MPTNLKEGNNKTQTQLEQDRFGEQKVHGGRSVCRQSQADVSETSSVEQKER